MKRHICPSSLFKSRKRKRKIKTSIQILLDTEERWLVSGIAASRVGAEADSRGFSRADRTV